MVNECGISLYFRDNRIHIWKKTIDALKSPGYVCLFINEARKQLFIQSCKKNKDAFRVYYKSGSHKEKGQNMAYTVQGSLPSMALSDIAEESSVPQEYEHGSARPERFYINAKPLLDYLARLIGVERESESLRYYGQLLPDEKTIYINLVNYEIITYSDTDIDTIARAKGEGREHE